MTVPDATIWLFGVFALAGWVILMLAIIDLAWRVRRLTSVFVKTTEQMSVTSEGYDRLSNTVDDSVFNVSKILRAAERYGSQARATSTPRSTPIFDPGEPPLFSSVAPKLREEATR